MKSQILHQLHFLKQISTIKSRLLKPHPIISQKTLILKQTLYKIKIKKLPQ